MIYIICVRPYIGQAGHGRGQLLGKEKRCESLWPSSQIIDLFYEYVQIIDLFYEYVCMYVQYVGCNAFSSQEKTPS